MIEPASAYRGDEPYVFVCYSHEDTGAVYPEINWLNGQGVHTWYDEGISAGKVWRTEIAEAIDSASTLVYFVSANSIESTHCNREVSYALDNGYGVLPVYLENVDLTPDLKLGLSRVQAIHAHTDKNYRSRLLDAVAPSGAGAEFGNHIDQRTIRGRRPLLGLISLAVLITSLLGAWHLLQRESPSPTSIAVLPFTDMSASGNQQHLSDGLADELITTLAQVEDLRVVARTSAFAFKDQQTDIRQIGEMLGVGSIIEGSVRTSGDRLRVTAQLIRASDGYPLWSERFDRQANDVFQVQDEIARAVATALKVELLSQPSVRSEIDFRTFELKKLGDHYQSKGDQQSLLQAIDHYEEAIIEAPNYSAAYVGLGSANRLMWINGYDPSEARRRQIVDATVRALALDPDNADALVMIGMDYAFNFQWAEAHDNLTRALRLEPNNVGVLVGNAYLASMLGDQGTAIEHAQKAVEADPLNPIAQYTLGFLYNFKEDWKPAAHRMERALTLGGTSAALRADLAYVYHRMGRDGDAFEVIIDGDLPEGAEPAFRDGFADGGFLGLIRAGIHVSVPEGTCGDYPWPAAASYAMIGERGAMYRCLEEAIERRQVLMITGIPCMHPYREEPQFKELLGRMNLPFNP